MKVLQIFHFKCLYHNRTHSQAPTIQNAVCRDQLEAAAREVVKSVTNLVESCNFATDKINLKGDLMAAATEVSRSLSDLLEYIKDTPKERYAIEEETHPVEKILVTTDLLVSSSDPQEMVRQARVLGQVTAELIQSIQGEAKNEQKPNEQHRLLAAAKKLADATTRMVEAARLCASKPNEPTYQNELRTAAEKLRSITASKANTPAIKQKIMQRLENCAKDAASSATRCIKATHNAIEYSEDTQTKEQLMIDCRTTTEIIPPLVDAVRESIDYPNDTKSQLNLIEISEQFIEAGNNVESSARAFYPTVQNHTAAQQLSGYALDLSHSIHDLSSATIRAREVCNGQELEPAVDSLKNLRSILNETRNSYVSKEMRPLPNETSDNTSQQLIKASQAVSLAVSQLLKAVTQEERFYAARAGRDISMALGDFTKSIRGVIATGKPTYKNNTRSFFALNIASVFLFCLCTTLTIRCFLSFHINLQAVISILSKRPMKLSCIPSI